MNTVNCGKEIPPFQDENVAYAYLTPPSMQQVNEYMEEIFEKQEVYAPENTGAFGYQVGGSHYKDMKIQPAVFCHRNAIGYLESCAIKYLSRWNKKHTSREKQLMDLNKAKQYIDMLIQEEFGK